MNYIRKFLVIIAPVLLVSLLISGCGSTQKSAFMSPQGIKVETLLPEDTIFVIKIGTSDDEQIENIKKLFNLFPFKESAVNSFNLVIAQADAMLAQEELSFENDIKPVFGSTPEVMLGYSASLITATNNPGVTPDFSAVVAVHDIEKTDQLIERAANSSTAKKEVIDGMTILYSTNQAQQFYLARIEDVVILTTKKENLLRARQNKNASRGTFLQTRQYQKAIANMKSNLSFMAIDLGRAFDELKKANGDPAFKELYDAIDGEMVAFYAEPEGIRTQVVVTVDQKSFKKLPYIRENKSTHAPYLIEKISATGTPYLYLEGYALQEQTTSQKNTMEEMEKSLNDVEGMEEVVASMKKIGVSVRQTFRELGMDFDTEIVPMLDKGYAVVIGKGGDIIPKGGLYIDVSSKPQTAEKLITKINEKLGEQITIIKKELPQLAPGFLFGTIEVNGKKVQQIGLDRSKLDPEVLPTKSGNGGIRDIIARLVEKNIIIWYGVDENIFFIRVNPKTEGEQPLDKNPVMNKLLAARRFKNGGIVMMSPAAITESLEVLMSPLGHPVHPIVSESLKLLPGFIGTFNVASDMEMDGFLLIEKP